MNEQLIAAIIGLFVGAIGAWVKAALAIREKINEELRGHRIDKYPAVYQLTAALSLWPPATMDYQELFQLNLALRQWYFTIGGLYLSATSRDRYGEMKQLICAYLDQLADEENRAAHDVSPDVYEDLTITARAFRNALTEDLETRRQRSLWWVLKAWQQHRKQHNEWNRLIMKTGDADREVRPYPLKQMPLPPLGPAPAAPAKYPTTRG